MIKLIAFDFNGTLISDTNGTLRSSNKIFKHYGLKPISLKKFRETFTVPIADFYTANGGNNKIDFTEQSNLYHPLHEAEAQKNRTRSGVREALHWLRLSHIKTMVYSNHVAPEIIKQLIRLNIYEYFDEVLARPLGDHSHMLKRSKDQKLKDYVFKNKLMAKEVLTIGDTEEEIEIGKKFGYYTVAITGGWNSTARLKKHNPDFIIHNMKSLIKIISKINAEN